MAGQLDSLLKSVAKQVVADLGSSLDTTITYTKKASGSYNTSTGVYTTTDTSYSISVPIEFVKSEEDEGKEMRNAKLYITPDLIGDNQVDFDDEITLNVEVNGTNPPFGVPSGIFISSQLTRASI